LAVVSLIVMPWLGFAKKKLVRRIGSRALDADGTETLVCSCLSQTLLIGLGANALWGWCRRTRSRRSPSSRSSFTKERKLFEHSPGEE
jgi:hypothetical protein